MKNTKTLKYEQLIHQFKIPLVCLKKDNGVLEVTLNNSEKLLLPQSFNQQLNIQNDEKQDGFVDCEAIFHIKLNKKKNFEVVENDNEFNLTLTKSSWSINNNEIPDPSEDQEYYKINSGDPLFDVVYAFLNKSLENGELDELITRNDGEPWTREEAKLALEIYLRTAHGVEYSDQMDMIKAYINNGYLNRSLPSVRMMVHGMCHFDEDHENSGLANLGKVFKDVWDEYHAGTLQVNLSRQI